MERESYTLVGSTAAQPTESVLIWDTIRAYFNREGMPVEYALFSTYNAMCGALLRGEIDIAWNAPMAHAQCLLASDGATRTLAMRDTDDDVSTVLLAKADSGITTPNDLRGRRVALGIEVSTELRLVPVHGLRAVGVDLERDCEIVELEPRPYSNGDRWVDDFMLFDALLAGDADVVPIFEPWRAHLIRKRGFEPSDFVEVWRSDPFCHCAFTARPDYPVEAGDRFVELLTAMDPTEPRIAEMMKREHMGRWLAADAAGWTGITEAIAAADLVGRTF